MVNKRVAVEQFVMFPFEFISPTEVTVEESSQGVAILRGTLLREGVSSNGNLYTIEEMADIAKQAEGMTIYVGTATKYLPNLGIWRKNMHANFGKNKVGKIIQAIFNKAKRAIKFVAEIVNTPEHPKIIEEVKQGWGISIGGKATKAKLIFDQFNRLLTKILGLKLHHVQLLPPSVAPAIKGARVEGVEIQESMIFYEYPEEVIVNRIKMRGTSRVIIHVS